MNATAISWGTPGFPDPNKPNGYTKSLSIIDIAHWCEDLQFAAAIQPSISKRGWTLAGDSCRLEQSVDAMGSTWTLVIYGPDETSMETALCSAFDELRRVDELISVFRPASAWSTINRHAATAPVEVTSEVFELLRRCRDLHRTTEGAFDITVGPLLELWGLRGEEGLVPSEAELHSATAVVGCSSILLDPVSRTVRFRRAGTRLDPGGIGKGYAIDCMVAVLRRCGVSSALLAASRSSIYAMGTPPESDRGWTVGIQDPISPARIIADVVLRDMAISTSGSYEKGFWSDGRRYCHIIDPGTGLPVQGMLQVCVISRSATDSEAWTKPCFVHGPRWTATHLPGGMTALLCEDGQTEPYTWIPAQP